MGKRMLQCRQLRISPVSSHINTASIERNNLTIRERNRRLTRKTLGFSKKKRLLVSSLNIYFGIYHFIKTHKGLRIRVDQKERKWMQRAPMIATLIEAEIRSYEGVPIIPILRLNSFINELDEEALDDQ